jgi:SNF2 family DNA or RNA helicase
MFSGTLYPYQEESVDFMIERGQLLLGLVMGAGKTVTTIAAIERLITSGDVDRCLVVVPASLKYQWKREIEKFTDSRVALIDGTPKAREKGWRSAISARYIIVNPESLMKDQDFLKSTPCQAIVVDEATMLKSRVSKRSKFIKKIAKPILYRYALTGQPIENRPEELFSIMEFVAPEVLGKFDSFDRTFIVRDHFGKPTRYRNLNVLHESMQSCMIRKTREDIADQLPKIITQVIPVAFDTRGADLYRIISNDLLHQLQQVIGKHGSSFNLWKHYNDPESNTAQGEIMARLTVLRMLCDNPELIRLSASYYADPSKPKQGSAYAHTIMTEVLSTPITSSPKMDAVVEYITDVLSEDPKNKVVLFSFFKENLRLIQKATVKTTNSVLFMGGMSAEERDGSKQKFSTDPDTRLFLSSDAGGYGVDLPMANYLISYDLPWSSGKLEQREARIIRLSSQFPHVTIATFVMKGSIEERQYEMLQQKRSINEAFVDGKHHDHKGGFDITLGSLSTFLRETSI